MADAWIKYNDMVISTGSVWFWRFNLKIVFDYGFKTKENNNASGIFCLDKYFQTLWQNSLNKAHKNRNNSRRTN